MHLHLPCLSGVFFYPVNTKKKHNGDAFRDARPFPLTISSARYRLASCLAGLLFFSPQVRIMSARIRREQGSAPTADVASWRASSEQLINVFAGQSAADGHKEGVRTTSRPHGFAGEGKGEGEGIGDTAPLRTMRPAAALRCRSIGGCFWQAWWSLRPGRPITSRKNTTGSRGRTSDAWSSSKD